MFQLRSRTARPEDTIIQSSGGGGRISGEEGLVPEQEKPQAHWSSWKTSHNSTAHSCTSAIRAGDALSAAYLAEVIRLFSCDVDAQSLEGVLCVINETEQVIYEDHIGLANFARYSDACNTANTDFKFIEPES